MTDTNDYVAQAKRQLDRLDASLNALEQKAQAVCANTDAWFDNEMSELRQDWHEARRKVARLAADGQARLDAHAEETKAELHKHWKALEDAADAYRRRLSETEETTAGRPSGS